MSAQPTSRAGQCAPWTPAKDKALEPFIWMQCEAPRKGGTFAPYRPGAAPSTSEQTSRPITTGALS